MECEVVLKRGEREGTSISRVHKVTERGVGVGGVRGQKEKVKLIVQKRRDAGH